MYHFVVFNKDCTFGTLGKLANDAGSTKNLTGIDLSQKDLLAYCDGGNIKSLKYATQCELPDSKTVFIMQELTLKTACIAKFLDFRLQRVCFDVAMGERFNDAYTKKTKNEAIKALCSLLSSPDFSTNEKLAFVERWLMTGEVSHSVAKI